MRKARCGGGCGGGGFLAAPARACDVRCSILGDSEPTERDKEGEGGRGREGGRESGRKRD